MSTKMCSGNRWYDQAFSEMVVDSMEFDFSLSGERIFWWCVMGGAQNLPRLMAYPSFWNNPDALADVAKGEVFKESQIGEVKDVEGQPPQAVRTLDISYRRKVTKIGFVWPKDPEESKKCLLPKVSVTWKDLDPDSDTHGQVVTREKPYDAVVNSTTMGVQQHMDLTGLNLNWGTKQAIRSLGYGASSKVGIRFKTLWWIDSTQHPDLVKLGIKTGISKGGVGHTDEPIGFCVYPSYNIDDNVKEPGVLLASYNWSQAAQRLSTLIKRDSPANEESLKDILLSSLARLHAPADKYEEMYKFLEEQYLDHYAWNWDNDEQTAGAFAFFGPGQFKSMYPWIIRNNGSYLMVGEAASAHHAWVVGALESAVRAVYQFLWIRSRDSNACSKAAQMFVQQPLPGAKGSSLEKSLFMELPPEFDRQDDIKILEKDPDAPPSSPKGEFLRQGIFVEVCRLLQERDQLKPGDTPKGTTEQFFGGDAKTE